MGVFNQSRNPISSPAMDEAISGARGSVRNNMPKIESYLSDQLRAGVPPEVQQFLDNRARLGIKENEGTMREFLARSPGGSVGMSAANDALLTNNLRRSGEGTSAWMDAYNRSKERGLNAAGQLSQLPGMWNIPASLEMAMLGLNQQERAQGNAALSAGASLFPSTYVFDEVMYGPSPQQQWYQNNAWWLNGLMNAGGQFAGGLGEALPFIL
jgi:hypothetical protein